MRRNYRQSDCSRRGMAMLVVLFIVAAIAIVASGFIARSDAQLQCGVNYADRVEADYLAWAGMEHARALVSSPDNTTPLSGWSGTDIKLDAASGSYYDLTIGSRLPAADPNSYTYTVDSTGYLQDGTAGVQSHLQGQLYYDPNNCYYLSVSRP